MLSDEEALDIDIKYAIKALEGGYLPDGFKEELTEYLEILYLIKSDSAIQKIRRL